MLHELNNCKAMSYYRLTAQVLFTMCAGIFSGRSSGFNHLPAAEDLSAARVEVVLCRELIQAVNGQERQPTHIVIDETVSGHRQLSSGHSITS